MVRYLTSSNCDGCHLKSGVPADSISELHGNSYIEYCIECGTKYPRYGFLCLLSVSVSVSMLSL